MGTWVFDVDGCLVDGLTGRSLRPGTVELLASVRQANHLALLWSAGGAAYARMRAEEHAIDGWFAGFFGKDRRDHTGHYVVDHLGAAGPIVFVDDHPEDLDTSHQLIGVPSYLRDDAHDRGLQPLIDQLASDAAVQLPLPTTAK